MTLAELSFACYVYSHMTDYDESYSRFLRATPSQLDLGQLQHRKALLKWLNEWGCRQFSIAYHDQAAEEILEWSRASGFQMFPANLTLLSLSDTDLDVVGHAFSELAGRTASRRRTKNGNESPVKIGPTGASKVLFALRPLALIPWDVPMRKRFELDGSGRSYVKYLHRVRDELDELEQDCTRMGHRLEDVPGLLGRSTPSLTKLVDEYFWVTISRKCPLPSKKDIVLWTT